MHRSSYLEFALTIPKSSSYLQTVSQSHLIIYMIEDWLVVWNSFFFKHILGIYGNFIIPTDELNIFQRGGQPVQRGDQWGQENSKASLDFGAVERPAICSVGALSAVIRQYWITLLSLVFDVVDCTLLPTRQPWSSLLIPFLLRNYPNQTVLNPGALHHGKSRNPTVGRKSHVFKSNPLRHPPCFVS